MSCMSYTERTTAAHFSRREQKPLRNAAPSHSSPYAVLSSHPVLAQRLVATSTKSKTPKIPRTRRLPAPPSRDARDTRAAGSGRGGSGPSGTGPGAVAGPGLGLGGGRGAAPQPPTPRRRLLPAGHGRSHRAPASPGWEAKAKAAGPPSPEPGVRPGLLLSFLPPSFPPSLPSLLPSRPRRSRFPRRGPSPCGGWARGAGRELAGLPPPAAGKRLCPARHAHEAQTHTRHTRTPHTNTPRTRPHSPSPPVCPRGGRGSRSQAGQGPGLAPLSAPRAAAGLRGRSSPREGG